MWGVHRHPFFFQMYIVIIYMPYKKKTKTTVKHTRKPFKKFYRKRKPTFRAIRSYGVKPDPFPTRLHTRCKYVKALDLSSSATFTHTVGTENVFRLSSIYDPDYTGTGETVVGHTQFNSLYENYIVKGAKVEITFNDPSHDGVTCFASLNQTSALQGKDEAWCMQDSLTYSSNLNNTGSQKKRMNFYVNPWALRGLTKLEWMANKSDHSSALGSNPTQDIYLRVGCSGSTLGSTIRCSVKIIYYTEFFNRKQLTQSV